MDETVNIHAAFIWSAADLLRGDYEQSAKGSEVGELRRASAAR